MNMQEAACQSFTNTSCLMLTSSYWRAMSAGLFTGQDEFVIETKNIFACLCFCIYSTDFYRKL